MESGGVALNESITLENVDLVKFDPWQELGYSGPLIVFFSIIIIFLNVLTMRVILGEHTLRQKLTFLLLVGQSISDLAVGLTAFLYYVVLVPAEGSFRGVFGCNFFAFMMTTSCHGTIFALAMIALSRKELIVGNKKPNMKRYAKMYAGLCWALPLLISTYYGLLTGFDTMEYHTFCNPRYTPGVFVVMGSFVVPPIVYIMHTYHRVWVTIKETTGNVKGVMNQKRRDKERAQSRRVTSVMILMCAVVLCGYMPIVIFGIWSLASSSPPPIHLERFVAIGIMFNSAASPMIYAASIKRVRQELLRVLRLKCLLSIQDRLQRSSTIEADQSPAPLPVLRQKSRWLLERVGIVRLAPIEGVVQSDPPLFSSAISSVSSVPLPSNHGLSNITSVTSEPSIPSLPSRVVYTGPTPDIDV